MRNSGQVHRWAGLPQLYTWMGCKCTTLAHALLRELIAAAASQAAVSRVRYMDELWLDAASRQVAPSLWDSALHVLWLPRL